MSLVPEHSPDVAYALDDRILGDDHVAPDAALQLLFADHLADVVSEHEQQLERLRAQSGWAALRIEQLATRHVEHETAEGEPLLGRQS